MLEKDPTTWSQSTWILAISMAASGGIINWLGRIREGHTRAFNIMELFGNIFTSGFVGVGVFMAAESLDQPIGLCAAAAGIGGHMAARLLFAVEKLLEKKITDLE